MAARGRPLLFALGGIIVVALIAAMMLLARPRTMPEGLIAANGRIEGDEIAVASKFAGRIRELRVAEGDQVAAGQVIAVIDDAQLRARLDGARAEVAAVEAEINAARTSLDVAQREVPLASESAAAARDQASAAVAKASAAFDQARRDADRSGELAKRGSLAKQRSEQSRLAAIAAERDLDAARAALRQAERQFSNARLGNERVRASRTKIGGLEARAEQARAAARDAESQLRESVLTAPTAGVIVSRVREPGEIVAAGSPIVQLVDLDHLYLRVFVPENVIGKVRLGAPARLWVDAFPDRSIAARVGKIGSRAEFTPKEVQTADERVRLVYAVKLYVAENRDRSLTPGMPADAVIRWKEGVPWTRPRL